MKIKLSGICDFAALMLLTATVFGFLGGLFWAFDLFSHFRVQYMQLCLVLIGITLWRRQYKRAVALVLLACVNYAFVLPLYFGKPSPSIEKPVRTMLMNLNAENGNTAQVLEVIGKANPDLLLLEEVTPKWMNELAPLKKEYKHRIAEPQKGCFGIMLLSKYPLEREKTLEIGSAGVPSIITEAHLPNGIISIIGTHPVPPIGSEFSRHRNSQLAALPAIVKKQKYPVVLIGDLNTTPWSPHFTKLIRESGLKNSMKGFGFQPTWPRNIRFLRIPLDHILHTPEIEIHKRMVGGDTGSDHLPVIVDFSIR